MEARTAIAGAITMTITVSPARNEYTANAGQTIFNYTFKIFQNTDLNVYVTPVGQDANDSTDITTLYTVTGIGDEDGGSITLAIPTNANDLVTIVSNIPSSRTTDYQNNGDFRPNVVNNDFDRVVSLVKKVEDRTNRGLLLPESQQDPKPLSLPIPKAGFPVRWNGDESGLENYDGSTVSNEEIANDKVVINYSTLNAALTDTSLKLNQEVKIREHTSGNGGGGFWYVVLGTGSDDGVFTRAHNTLDLSLIYMVRENTVFADEVGIIPGSGQTTKIATFLEYIHDNKIKGVMRSGQYDVDAQLLAKSTAGKFILICQDGQAIFNYTGSEIGNLIQASEVDAIQVMNIDFECNDLVANPLDLRKITGTPTGNAGLFNVNSSDCKQTTLTTNPTGMLISGAYKKIGAQDCGVDGVSYVDAARASSGMAIINVSGIVSVSGCIISNISTPSDQDADGLAIFGSDVATITSFLGARAEVYNNIFSDCEGRFIKLQISDYEVHGNQFKLSTGFSTITEWRAIDGQANNGDIHSNTMRFGSAITFGSNANLFTLQNIRNDGGNKTSNVYKNRCTSETNISMMFNLVSNFGTCIYNLDDNEYIGSSVARMVRHTVTTLATTDEIRINARNNKAAITGELFDPTNDIDFGTKLYLEIVDNENLGAPNIRIYDDGATNFSVGANFRFRNNVGIKHRINWIFDHNDLPPGNSFYTGAQVNLNKAPNVGTNFYHVDTDGYWQRSTNTSATSEDRRASLDGIAWGAWVAV